MYWSPEMISCRAAIVASIAGDRRNRLHAGCLEGRDRTAAGAVIGSHDTLDLIAEAGDLAGRPFLRLRGSPFGRVVLSQRL